MKEWFKAAGIRALKTIAQTAVATIGVGSVFSEIDWLRVISASLLAGLLSILTSLAGLPELKKEEEYINVISDTPEVYEEEEEEEE